MTPYIGMVIPIGFTFAPPGWLMCDGSLQAISNYETLFTLIGTTYGGDGQQTFALPDLRGRTPLHQGQGPGLSNYALGQVGGAANVTLVANNLPTHTHPLACSVTPTGPSAANAFFSSVAGQTFIASASNENMGDIVGASGGSQPHTNLQPYLTINWIIATQGIYPSQS